MREVDLYEQIARYVKSNYPGVTIHFDLSGVNNPSTVTRALYSRLNGRAFPDLIIFANRTFPDGSLSGALALELKREGTRIKKKNGRWANEHVEEQAAMLEQLAAAGYVAQFAVGFDAAVEIIDSYLVPAWEPPIGMDPLTGEYAGTV